MDIQPRDLNLLAYNAESYTTTVEQIRRTVCPENADTSVLRRRLWKMLADGLINVTRAEVITAINDVHVPVYYPSRKGLELLALRTGEMKWLQAPCRPPYSQHLAHFVALTDLRDLIKTAAAAAARPLYDLDRYFNQFDVVNPDAQDPAKRYQLHTVVHSEQTSASGELRQVVCVPDGAFGLRVNSGVGSNAVVMPYYLELERGTTPPGRACAKKSPGFTGLYERKLHKRHFPDASDEFRVLILGPTRFMA